MAEGICWVGMDVHASRTSIAVIDTATGELSRRVVHGRPHEALEFLTSLDGPIRAVYEAGPTGYGLARRGRAAGLDIQVCAPAMIPSAGPGSRVKTDAKDAVKLARLHAAGQLALVVVPTVEQEQVRDLIRAREAIRMDLMRARHRIGKLLLRRELYYQGRSRAWTAEHRQWLRGIRFDDVSTESAFADYLHAHDSILARRELLDARIQEVAEACSYAAQVARLRCLRGINTLAALGLCAELRDFTRFSHPHQVAAFVGIVPSEHTSGDKRRQGSITKAGSQHARRLLVEAAWHYRLAPRVSRELQCRQAGADPQTIDIAWRAQRRLHTRWRQLHTKRGKRSTITAIAVARELSHFCWEITQP